MNYLDSGITHFIGMQRITGQVSDKTGSFTLQIEGDYDGKQVTATYRILEGSGTEGLAGISGTGSLTSNEDGSSDYVLDYKLD